LDLRNPSFVLIGAFSLLLRRTLFRRSFWDIDLLFRDETALRRFVGSEERTGARIVHYDDTMVLRPGISSLHTTWRFQRAWVNLDYILRAPYFEFYIGGLTGSKRFRECVHHAGRDYEISLYVAHPWDVLIDKMLSPRFEKELESRNSMGVDLRHVFLLLRLYGATQEFWDYILRRISEGEHTGRFSASLREVLRAARGISEEGIGVSDLAERALGEIERWTAEEGSDA
jgi:hypothetical protein